MPNPLKFTVYGAPFAKQRPRHNRYTGVTYTPAATKEHERGIAAEFLRQCGKSMPAGSAVKLTVAAFMPIPKSAAKKRREAMLSGEIRPTVKPDWDNIGKLVADALNGVAYDDDKCVVEAVVRKIYSDRPRVEVEVSEVGKEDI